MSKFVIRDGNTKFRLMCGNTSFVLHDYIEIDVLHINFDEETGIYNFSISNPSKSTKRALRDGELKLGISTCDISAFGYKCRSGNDRRAMEETRPYKISGGFEHKIYWKVSEGNRILIDDLSSITWDVHSINIPDDLRAQKGWVIRNIDRYGWPESTLKDFVTVDYKFVLMGLNGRAIKSYKTIYTAEVFNGRVVEE